MLMVIFLTSLISILVCFSVFFLMIVVMAMEMGYPDASFKPAPGRRWPRVTVRTIMAVIRGRA